MIVYDTPQALIFIYILMLILYKFPGNIAPQIKFSLGAQRIDGKVTIRTLTNIFKKKKLSLLTSNMD